MDSVEKSFADIGYMALLQVQPWRRIMISIHVCINDQSILFLSL